MVRWTGITEEGFEDELVERIDYQRRLQKLMRLLSEPEQELLVRIASGEKPGRADKDVLYRLRRKIRATKLL